MGLFIRKFLGSWILLTVILLLLTTALSRMRAGSASLVLAGQRADTSEIKSLAEQIGENRSFAQEFFLRLKNLLTLDFGETIHGERVLPFVLQALKITILLALIAAIFSLVYGLSLAYISQSSPLLRAILLKANYVVLSIPVFVIALGLLFVFSIQLHLFPASGTANAHWMWLPAIALGSKTGCRLFLFADEFFQREFPKPYVRTARAFGISESRIVSPFVLKNIALPVLNYWLIDFASYLAGAAIVETIFSLPGIGYQLLHSLHQYDLNLMMGILIVAAFMVFLISMISEFLDIWFQRYSE